MASTFRRQPINLDIPSNLRKTYNSAVTTFAGIQKTKAPVEMQPNVMSDALNVYVDDDYRFVTRKRLHPLYQAGAAYTIVQSVHRKRDDADYSIVTLPDDSKYYFVQTYPGYVVISDNLTSASKLFIINEVIYVTKCETTESNKFGVYIYDSSFVSITDNTYIPLVAIDSEDRVTGQAANIFTDKVRTSDIGNKFTQAMIDSLDPQDLRGYNQNYVQFSSDGSYPVWGLAYDDDEISVKLTRNNKQKFFIRCVHKRTEKSSFAEISSVYIEYFTVANVQLLSESHDHALFSIQRIDDSGGSMMDDRQILLCYSDVSTATPVMTTAFVSYSNTSLISGANIPHRKILWSSGSGFEQSTVPTSNDPAWVICSVRDVLELTGTNLFYPAFSFYRLRVYISQSDNKIKWSWDNTTEFSPLCFAYVDVSYSAATEIPVSQWTDKIIVNRTVGKFHSFVPLQESELVFPELSCVFYGPYWTSNKWKLLPFESMVFVDNDEVIHFSHATPTTWWAGIDYNDSVSRYVITTRYSDMQTLVDGKYVWRVNDISTTDVTVTNDGTGYEYCAFTSGFIETNISLIADLTSVEGVMTPFKVQILDGKIESVDVVYVLLNSNDIFVKTNGVNGIFKFPARWNNVVVGATSYCWYDPISRFSLASSPPGSEYQHYDANMFGSYSNSYMTVLLLDNDDKYSFSNDTTLSLHHGDYYRKWLEARTKIQSIDGVFSMNNFLIFTDRGNFVYSAAFDNSYLPSTSVESIRSTSDVIQDMLVISPTAALMFTRESTYWLLGSGEGILTFLRPVVSQFEVENVKLNNSGKLALNDTPVAISKDGIVAFVDTSEQTETSKNIQNLTRGLLSTYSHWFAEAGTFKVYRDVWFNIFCNVTQLHTKILFFDCRSSAWWYWELPVRVSNIYRRDDDICVVADNGDIYHLTDADYIDPYSKLKLYRDKLWSSDLYIPWFVKSHPMSLGTVDRAKLLRGINVSLLPNYGINNYRINLKLLSYNSLSTREHRHEVLESIRELLPIKLRTFIPKFNYLAYELSSEDLVGHYNKLLLSSLSFSYQILDKLS